jgi:hypothetical protein
LESLEAAFDEDRFIDPLAERHHSNPYSQSFGQSNLRIVLVRNANCLRWI